MSVLMPLDNLELKGAERLCSNDLEFLALKIPNGKFTFMQSRFVILARVTFSPAIRHPGLFKCK
jgi:hypothetical protein